MKVNLKIIDFIADMINQNRAREKGYICGTRWLTLHKDLKMEYRKEAEELYENWKVQELEAKQSREK